jgi:hypothetical protein
MQQGDASVGIVGITGDTPRLVDLGGGETSGDIGKEVESKEKQEEKVFHGCFSFFFGLFY